MCTSSLATSRASDRLAVCSSSLRSCQISAKTWMAWAFGFSVSNPRPPCLFLPPVGEDGSKPRDSATLNAIRVQSWYDTIGLLGAFPPVLGMMSRYLWLAVLLGTAMSVQRGQRGGEVDSWVDYTFQHVAHKHGKEPAATGINNANTNKQFQFEAAGGLQHNELAELATLHRMVSLHTSGASGDNTEPGKYETEGGLGVNLEGDEWARVGNPGALYDLDGDGTDESNIVFGTDVENAQFDTWGFGASAQFKDGANTSAGGGSAQNIEQFYNFRELYHSGPFVGPNDDMVSRIELDWSNQTHQMEAMAHYWLGWIVYETDQQPQLAPPNR